MTLVALLTYFTIVAAVWVNISEYQSNWKTPTSTLQPLHCVEDDGSVVMRLKLFVAITTIIVS